MMRNILRHPLLHFLVLGAALYLLYVQVWEGPGTGGGSEIVVSEGRIQNLTTLFARTWQRAPTPQELNDLVEDFIREEIYYREALALGLERDDTVVRRRLRQKYEFLTEGNRPDDAPPTDAELTTYLNAHADRFGPEHRYSFEQVYLNPERRGAKLRDDASVLLQSLQAGTQASAGAGDSLLVGTTFDGTAASDVARLFGPEFAAALADAPPGQWTGPLDSGYGVHLVRVTAVDSPPPPTLASVRNEVVVAFDEERRRNAATENYRALRARYRVIIASPADTSRAVAAP